MHKIEKVSLPKVKHIIAVASGKGGVGKSTVAANIALSFSQNGYKTALVDADLYGPSIPTMFGIKNEQLTYSIIDGKEYFIPIEKYGVKIVSIGSLVKPEQALIWRGPMASSVLLQLFSNTDWGDIDYMVVDLPPGTGDIPLTLCQQVDVNGIVIVTTPQQVSLIDVRKVISLFQNPDLNINVLGIIENMSWYSPNENSDDKHYIFGKNGGELIAKEYNIDLLSQIPLINGMTDAADNGNFKNYNNSKIVQEQFNNIIEKISYKLNNTNNNKMRKIAAPVTKENQIDEHFGHCEFYKIFTLSNDNQITNSEVVKSEGCGCKTNIDGWLKSRGVTTMLAGGIGAGAINVLNAIGIEVVRGCSGNADEVVNQYLAGLIIDSGESCKEHEEHHKDGQTHECKH